MDLEAFYDERTSTLTYVVWDAKTRDAVAIDPVMDYEPAGATTWTESVDKVTSFLEAEGLKLHFVLEPHTPACATYRIEDMLFTGDALFMPDSGAGRCDFPGGSATDLYESVTQRIYTQPDETRIFVGHDYQPGGRELRYETSVGEEKASNVALSASTSKEDFIEFREQRDAQLPAPKLLFQSVQVNVDAGRLPAASGGIRHLKIPLNVFKPKDVSEVQRLSTCEAVQPTGGQG